MMRTVPLVGALTLILASIAWACGDYSAVGAQPPNEQVARELRELGPAGLQEALRMRDEAVQHDATAESEKTWRCFVDRVAAQRDASVSRLYWYTDLKEAQAAALESGRPILSLRMLGKLTDQYSCANSRFFRTALYANDAVSEELRSRFVLHWQSVRPVPRVTIDFGDGRVLNRTITGNSAHYILASDGRPLDVLPGLYGPQQFLAWLDRCESLAARDRVATIDADRSQLIVDYHARQLDRLGQQWQADLLEVEADHRQGASVTTAGRLAAWTPLEKDRPRLAAAAARGVHPTALEAAPIAVGKGAIEVPLLNLVAANTPREYADDNQLWTALAALRRSDVQLDESSRSVIRREHPSAMAAGARAESKRIVEDPILRLVRNFEDSIARDAVRNEYLLHWQIHQWFVDGDEAASADELNERVYAELFLTPSSDPWLGLDPGDDYTGLEGSGLSDASTLGFAP